MSFKVENERYNSNSDFGAKQIIKLVSLLDMALKRDPTFGYGDAIYRNEEFSFTMDRNKPQIRIYAPMMKDIIIKELSDKQVSNLIKKLDSHIDERIVNRNKNYKKNELYVKLSELHIDCSRGFVGIKGSPHTFSIDSDNNLEIFTSITLREYFYLRSDDISKVRLTLDKFCLEYEKTLVQVEIDKKELMQHIDLILQYHNMIK